jgi:hypothetical protein
MEVLAHIKVCQYFWRSASTKLKKNETHSDFLGRKYVKKLTLRPETLAFGGDKYRKPLVVWRVRNFG